MNKLSCCMTVMIAGLVMSSGAYATELEAPKHNLGAATISAAQSDAGFLGLSQTATGAIVLGLGAVVIFKAVDGISTSIETPVDIGAPITCCFPIPHH